MYNIVNAVADNSPYSRRRRYSFLKISSLLLLLLLLLLLYNHQQGILCSFDKRQNIDNKEVVIVDVRETRVPMKVSRPSLCLQV